MGAKGHPDGGLTHDTPRPLHGELRAPAAHLLQELVQGRRARPSGCGLVGLASPHPLSAHAGEGVLGPWLVGIQGQFSRWNSPGVAFSEPPSPGFKPVLMARGWAELMAAEPLRQARGQSLPSAPSGPEPPSPSVAASWDIFVGLSPH